MKAIKKNVYYCDHCNKRSLAKWHMRKHEIGCTNNPNRACRICSNPSVKELVKKFKTRFTLKQKSPNYYTDDDTHLVWYAEWTSNPITLQEIKDSVNGCPNCTLAIIRQTGVCRHEFDEIKLEPFDYKKEMIDWFAENMRYQYN